VAEQLVVVLDHRPQAPTGSAIGLFHRCGCGADPAGNLVVLVTEQSKPEDNEVARVQVRNGSQYQVRSELVRRRSDQLPKQHGELAIVMALSTIGTPVAQRELVHCPAHPARDVVGPGTGDDLPLVAPQNAPDEVGRVVTSPPIVGERSGLPLNRG